MTDENPTQTTPPIPWVEDIARRYAHILRTATEQPAERAYAAAALNAGWDVEWDKIMKQCECTRCKTARCTYEVVASPNLSQYRFSINPGDYLWI